MRKINFAKNKEVWVEYPEDKDIKFKIRAFPLSQGMYVPGNSDESLFEYYNKKVQYCVTEWQGIEGEEGVLECNAENKHYLFNYEEDLFLFVVTEITRTFENNDISAEKKT